MSITGYKCKLKVLIIEDERYKNFGDFGKKCNVKPSTLSSIMNDRHLPEFRTLHRILKEIKKPIDEVWKEERKMYKVVFWQYGTRSYDEFETEEKAREAFRHTESEDTSTIECVLDPNDQIIEGKNIGEKYDWA